MRISKKTIEEYFTTFANLGLPIDSGTSVVQIHSIVGTLQFLLTNYVNRVIIAIAVSESFNKSIEFVYIRLLLIFVIKIVKIHFSFTGS